jgi:hypothetical protein
VSEFLNANAGYVFITAWGLGALVLGWFFTFRPEGIADQYISQMARFRTTNRLRERLAPRGAILVWYRIGGVVFMMLGVVLPVLAYSGVLPIRPLTG